MQRPPHRPDPTIGGVSARLVLDILESFPLSIGYRGEVLVHDTSRGERAEVFQRAYAASELSFLDDHEHCSAAHEHHSLDPYDYRMAVLRELAYRARTALGEAHLPSGLWL